MKKIAFYLPQFHSIPENDEWWGKRFTEWNNVRTSKPQFHGHIQPEVPLNNNYYCLLDSESQIWQANLAKEYGIDAFCYYHYWFEGKLLLEKPMENMLLNKAVDIPFCVCWANETWSRTWDGKEKSYLIKQNYNEDEAAWKKHFDYLYPFLEDERYLKDDGRPIFLIYKPYLITNCKEMVAYWRKLAKEYGLPGLYIGYQFPESFNYDMEEMGFDFGVEFEPLYTVHELWKEKDTKWKKCSYFLMHPKQLYHKIAEKYLKKPVIYNYDEIWSYILKRTPKNENICPGAFPSWDNTPRRGNTAIIHWKSSPEKFVRNLQKQLERAENLYHSNYLFINAWNEWAEGAHLEPDEVNGYGYLEAVRSCARGE